MLSGNRNFEGRINQHVKANYLASPPLVVAYAIVGSVNHDFNNDPLGIGDNGQPVYLKDIWPSDEEINNAEKIISSEMYLKEYENADQSSPMWNAIKAPAGEVFQWNEFSTYIQNPPFFKNMGLETNPVNNLSLIHI